MNSFRNDKKSLCMTGIWRGRGKKEDKVRGKVDYCILIKSI